MVLCFVPRCDHFSERNKCKYFRFPSNAKLRNKWIKALRRKDKNPTNASRVCSCHFKDGKKANEPSIFAWNENQSFQFASPKGRKKRTVMKRSNESAGRMLQFDHSIASNSSSVVFEAEIDLLHREIEQLKAEVQRLKNQPFGFHSIRNDKTAVLAYTGLSSDAFDIINHLCAATDFDYYYKWKVQIMNLEDQILLTLMKLRLGCINKDLSVRFNCSKSTINNIILTFLSILHKILFTELMNEVPSQDKNAMCLPNCFMSFKNCRMIIDCTEFSYAIPYRIDEQKATFSSYKQRNTLKGLIGIVPNGVITYCSDLYPGSVSDKKIVEHSGIVKIFKSGDLILADKGFILHDIVPKDVSVNIPPFLETPQFTPHEIEETKNIARARIHVERAIQRLKCYKILKFIPKSLYEHSSQVFQLCAALTNFQNPLIKEVGKYYVSDPEELCLSESASEDED